MPMTILVCAEAAPGTAMPTAASAIKTPKVLRILVLPDFAFARYPASSGHITPESAILPDRTSKNNEPGTSNPAVPKSGKLALTRANGRALLRSAIPRLHNYGQIHRRVRERYRSTRGRWPVGRSNFPPQSRSDLVGSVGIPVDADRRRAGDRQRYRPACDGVCASG